MFAEDEDEKVHNLKATEMICEIYNIEQIRDLNARLNDNSTAKQIFLQVRFKIIQNHQISTLLFFLKFTVFLFCGFSVICSVFSELR